jgi:uncharacterized protein YjiS (DUF1127 family)
MSPCDRTALPPSSYELHIYARRERDHAIGALMVRFARKVAQFALTPVRLSVEPLRALAEEWRCRRAIRALHQCDDRMRADIGVGHSEIEWRVRGAPAGPARRMPRGKTSLSGAARSRRPS